MLCLQNRSRYLRVGQRWQSGFWSSSQLFLSPIVTTFPAEKYTQANLCETRRESYEICTPEEVECMVVTAERWCAKFGQGHVIGERSDGCDWQKARNDRLVCDSGSQEDLQLAITFPQMSTKHVPEWSNPNPLVNRRPRLRLLLPTSIFKPLSVIQEEMIDSMFRQLAALNLV